MEAGPACRHAPAGAAHDGGGDEPGVGVAPALRKAGVERGSEAERADHLPEADDGPLAGLVPVEPLPGGLGRGAHLVGEPAERNVAHVPVGDVAGAALALGGVVLEHAGSVAGEHWDAG